jgi:hypothetical protein
MHADDKSRLAAKLSGASNLLWIFFNVLEDVAT